MQEEIALPEEKITSQIIRGELDHHTSINEYAILYEQKRILYGTILACLITLLIVAAGF